MSISKSERPSTGWGAESLRAQTGLIVFADGTMLPCTGAGAPGIRVGEICFNTAMTGYQEILTDPSYAGQIVLFTFPHIGNVGANLEDVETATPAVRGCILRAEITAPANWRARGPLDDWLRSRDIVAVTGVDTRALTKRLREKGALNAVIAYDPSGEFQGEFAPEVLAETAADWPGLEGMDLAKEVTAGQTFEWTHTRWTLEGGYGEVHDPQFHVVVVDYGVKRNILRSLCDVGCRVTVVPATASWEDIARHKPDGVLLSNGPGDPAATGDYTGETIKRVVDSGLPTFGICLGHQMLALSLGAKTKKMHQGHHGANHPVKDHLTGKVEITSMNHGFTVDTDDLPAGLKETHRSLFDGSNCGLELEGKPVFSVQYHPEASPGPQDSHYLFERFLTAMRHHRRSAAKA